MSTDQAGRLTTIPQPRAPQVGHAPNQGGIDTSRRGDRRRTRFSGDTPAANADPSTVVLPDLPELGGNPVDPESLGVAPFFAEFAEQSKGAYTDSLGDSVTTATANSQLLQVSSYEFNSVNPSLFVENVSDPNLNIASIDAASVIGTVEGSQFSLISTTSGLNNIFEDTPFQATGAFNATQNINDVFAYDPSGSPIESLSGIESGI